MTAYRVGNDRGDNSTSLGIGSFSGDGGPAIRATGVNVRGGGRQDPMASQHVLKGLSYRFLCWMEEWKQK